jgi:site-specific DNA-methyltransferase (adenine-specific)
MGEEHFVCVWCSPTRSEWNGGGKIGLYFHPIPRGDKRYHETQKPFSLMVEILEDFTNPGQLVMDPFAGSGTTLIAAKALGRKFLGVEAHPEYCKVANERILDPMSLPERFRGSQMVLL